MSSKYFSALYGVSRDLIDELSLPNEAMSLSNILGQLKSEIENRRTESLERLRMLRTHYDDGPDAAMPRNLSVPVGLNTIGFLSDRLTVLAMKEWVLQVRLGDWDKAKLLHATQVVELTAALASAQPGYSSFSQKISPLEADAAAKTWEEAYLGLLSVNILLWEAQEILYAGRIEGLECAELRRYIAWFSEGNIRRNNYIASCETLYWEGFPGKYKLGYSP